jgi:WD40 repeat protein
MRIIIIRLQSKLQRFIHGSQNSEGPQAKNEITAIAVSPNKRFVAVAEKGEERAIIVIYDVRTLKKRKKLRQPTSASATGGAMKQHEYVSLCFSADSKSLLSQGNGPDHVLVNWLWEKAKPLQISKVNATLDLTQCSFAPNPTPEMALVAVTGSELLQFFKLDANSTHLTPIQHTLKDGDGGGGAEEKDGDDAGVKRVSKHVFTVHVWVTAKRCIVGTENGDLLLFDNAFYKQTLQTSPSAGVPVSSIATTNLGFVVGMADGGVFVYESHAGHVYKRTRAYAVPDNANGAAVTGVAISPNDDSLAVTTSTSQAWCMSLFNTDAVRAEEMRFQRLGCANHNGKVTGMDVCARKPLVVTCGVDKTVRVWNYKDRSIELMKTYREQPYSVAFHPSGLHIIVGFADKLRLLNVLMDDLRVYKDLPIKQCCEVRWSHGGQYFAAVNGGLVQVYNSYTCEQINIFRGHTGKILSLYWSLDDTSIVSAGEDGAVYERRLNVATRAQEYVQKGCKFTSALRSEDGKIYAVGDDRVLKEITERNVSKSMDFRVALTQLMVSHPPQRMLFAGTATGLIRVLKMPLTGDFRDYQAHSGPVTRLCVSVDDSVVFSVGADGCLCVLNVQENDGRLSKKDRPDAVAFSDEVLVTKADLEEKQAMMNELKGKVDELTASNEYQLRLHDMNYQEKLKEVSEKYNLQIEHDRARVELLKDETQDLQMEFDEKTKALQQAHANKLHEEDLEHQKKIMKEVDLYQELGGRMSEEAAQYNEMVKDRHILAQQEVNKLREKYEVELHRENLESQSVQEAKDVIQREFGETMRQMEEDTDREITVLTGGCDSKLHAEKDATLRLKGENGIMKKKFSALQKDIEDQKDNIKTMSEKEEELNAHIYALEQKILNHKVEISERDVTITNKEKGIYMLKRDNQELEKYKFVLDYQIKELKRQIEPREKEIADMKEKVMKMDGQLETYHKDNGALQETVEDLERRLQVKQNSIHVQRQKYRVSLSELQSMKNDVAEIVQHIQDPPRLKTGVKALYVEHVDVQVQTAEVDHDVNAEYRRQRQFLERSVHVLKRKLTRDGKARRSDNMRVMQENVALIKEINELRGEIKLISQVQKARELNKAQQDNALRGRTRVHNNDDGDDDDDDYEFDEAEIQKIIDLQRSQIATLRIEVEQAQARMFHTRPR